MVRHSLQKRLQFPELGMHQTDILENQPLPQVRPATTHARFRMAEDRIRLGPFTGALDDIR